MDALCVSDSDRESDYMTGVEDLMDGVHRAGDVEKGISTCFVPDSSQTSSFIQNILYEDSCAGVAVVDLFVSVKTVKDNLDFLARCNNEVFDRIDDLNRDTKAFKEQYGALLGSVHRFLAKMNADAEILDIPVPPNNPIRLSVTSLTKTYSNGLMELQTSAENPVGDTEVDVNQTEGQKEEKEDGEEGGGGEKECSECGGTESVATGSTKSKGGCLSCLMQSLKDRSFCRMPVLSEAFMGSFIASMLWLQNGRSNHATSSKSSSPVESDAEEKKKKKKKKRLTLRRSAIRMVSDFCEMFGGSDLEQKERSLRGTEDTDLSSKPSFASSFTHPGAPPTVVDSSQEVSCLYQGQHAFQKDGLKKGRSKDSFRTTTEELSEDDSEFEEALSVAPKPSTHFDLGAKPSVTCMGDLSKAVAAKKSASAFTSAISVLPSWIEKLSTEIISKLRKRKSKTSVQVYEKPYEKPKGLKTAPGRLEFTVAANTPVGVFDVTVVQYKKSRLLRERMMQLKSNPINTSSISYPTHERYLSGGMIKLREDDSSWSEDSVRNIESEAVSNSGESDFEEFIEIFLEQPKGNKKTGKPIRGSQEKGNMKRVELMTCRPNFFEIQKCYAVNFVQEMIQKRSRGEQQPEEMRMRQMDEQKVLSLNTGEKKQKQVVIEGSTSDLVIYIQVEMEDGPTSPADGVYLEYQKSSLGTQTAETPRDPPPKEKTIKLEEEKPEGVSLYQIWKGCEKTSSTVLKTVMSVENKPEVDSLEYELAADEEEEVLEVKEPKMVTFNEELSEIFIEKELQKRPGEETHTGGGTADARDVDVRDAKQHADVWLFQQNFHRVQRGEIRNPQQPPRDLTPVVSEVPLELQKALKLIREIESDVVDVKLSDAISILPRLETELRKHLQDKMRGLGEKETERETSLHNFFSAIDFWPEESGENESETSEDRLNNLLSMLADLEEAVKSSEHSANIDMCQCNSSKIYKLLQALTTSIRELEGSPNMMSLSQTLEIASQLDTAVREYDNIVRRQPVEYVSSEKSARRNWKAETKSELSVMQHLKNVRKKVFGMVEEEAIEVEGRIEKDFDRLDRLEGENDEALMFLETFLQKTERRVVELADLKLELKELSSTLNKMYEEVKEVMTRKKEVEVLQIKGPEDHTLYTDSSMDSVSVPAPVPTSQGTSEPLRETISGLLIALDTLKSRARHKKELCREILTARTIDRGHESENTSQRSSRSSFTTKHGDKLYATVKEFKKIGHTSLYLAWTKPEGPLKRSIVGYQIHVNEKLNQKVRNPHRLQAVLYSVDLSQKADIQLYALTENGPKILLATVSYQDE